MKANEAPEKIYLLKSQDRILDRWYNEQPIPKTFEQVEYIRTDAFIEKACSTLKELGFQNDIIEQFKNYLKGE